jgi:hypothetical protein
MYPKLWNPSYVWKPSVGIPDFSRILGLLTQLYAPFVDQVDVNKDSVVPAILIHSVNKDSVPPEILVRIAILIHAVNKDFGAHRMGATESLFML